MTFSLRPSFPVSARIDLPGAVVEKEKRRERDRHHRRTLLQTENGSDDRERAGCREGAAAVCPPGAFDEIIRAGADKAVRVSLMTRHTYKTRGRLYRAPGTGHNSLLNIVVAGTAFVFAVLQAYNVLRGDDNARIVYVPGPAVRMCVRVCPTYATLIFGPSSPSLPESESRAIPPSAPLDARILALSRVRARRYVTH